MRPGEHPRRVNGGFFWGGEGGSGYRGGGGGGGYLAGFVLGDFVLGVLFALFAFAVGAAGFGDLDGGIFSPRRQCLAFFFFKKKNSLPLMFLGGVEKGG